MQLKRYQQGTHRVISPDETLEKIKPFLQQMGITRVANITGLDNVGIPVVAVCRPNSKSLAVSQGKGHSLSAAKASAVMESIEGYHAENVNLPMIETTYEDIKKSNTPVIAIENLSRSCEKDFCDNTVIRWLSCKNINDNSSIWVPHEVINAAFTVPVSDDHGYFMADSNGLASGNSLVEAINHALYEVIERDCLAFWQLTPEEVQQTKRIDIDTIEDGFLLSIIQKLTKQNIHIGVWNITNDLGIPTFICKIVADQNTGIRPAYGSGTHLNKNIALSRAITEAAQSRLTFISGARDDQYQDVYDNEISDSVYQTWIDEMITINAMPLNSFSYIPFCDFDYLEEDQNYILSRLEKAGLTEAIYADLTNPAFNIPVVKVVVPGLEGVTHPERRCLNERGLKIYNKYGVGACAMTS